MQETTVNLPFITPIRTARSTCNDAHPGEVRTARVAPGRAPRGRCLNALRTRSSTPAIDEGRSGQRLDPHAPRRSRSWKESLSAGSNKEREPDEVVAIGARPSRACSPARSGHPPARRHPAFSLGVETLGGVMTPPHRTQHHDPDEQETFSTAADSQTSVTIHVLQGEREVRQDKHARQLRSHRHPPGAAGVPQIEVEFALDANGIPTVTATDKTSGRRRISRSRIRAACPGRDRPDETATPGARRGRQSPVARSSTSRTGRNHAHPDPQGGRARRQGQPRSARQGRNALSNPRASFRATTRHRSRPPSRSSTPPAWSRAR